MEVCNAKREYNKQIQQASLPLLLPLPIPLLNPSPTLLAPFPHRTPAPPSPLTPMPLTSTTPPPTTTVVIPPISIPLSFPIPLPFPLALRMRGMRGTHTPAAAPSSPKPAMAATVQLPPQLPPDHLNMHKIAVSATVTAVLLILPARRLAKISNR